MKNCGPEIARLAGAFGHDAPAFASHTRAASSELVVTTPLPSGEKATVRTSLLCPMRMAGARPLSASPTIGFVHTCRCHPLTIRRECRSADSSLMPCESRRDSDHKRTGSTRCHRRTGVVEPRATAIPTPRRPTCGSVSANSTANAGTTIILDQPGLRKHIYCRFRIPRSVIRMGEWQPAH